MRLADHLLRQLAGLLSLRIRGRDTLARLGGDEFALLLERCALQHARRVVEDLRKTIAGFGFRWQGRVFHPGASLGLVRIDAQAGDGLDLLRRADAACYAAKAAGGNRVVVAGQPGGGDDSAA